MKRSLFLLFCTVLCVSFGFAQYGNTVYPNSIGITSTGRILAGTQDALWMLSNNTWTRISGVELFGSSIPLQGGFKPVELKSNGVVLYIDDDFDNTGNLWRSTDNGTTWTNPATSGLPHTTVSTIVVDESGNFLAGSVRITGNTNGGGVWKSTDDGSTWSLLGNQSSVGLDTMQVLSVVPRGTNIFTGTTLGIFRSTDNGLTWNQSGLSGNIVRSITVNDSGHIFAGCSINGVYRSTDNGQTWVQTSLNSYTVRVLTYKNGILLGGTPFNGIFRSTDNGTTWTSANTGLLTDLPQGLDIYSLAADSAENFFAGTLLDGLFKSTDGGQTWSQIGIPVGGDQILAKGNDLQFAISTRGYPYRSTNEGASWRRMNIPGATSGIALASNGDILLGSQSNYGVFKSTDDGVTWATLPSAPNHNVYSLVSTSQGYILMGSAGGGIYRSTDNGTTWTNPYAGVTNIQEMTISTASANYGYLFAAHATTNGGMLRSTDDGATWTTIGLDNTGVYAILVDLSGNVYVGTDGGLLKSTNNGNSWFGPILGYQILSLAVNAANIIFAGTAGNGMFRSINEGTTWEPYNDGQAKISANFSIVYSIAIDDTGYLYAGTTEGVVRSTHNTIPPIAPVFTLNQTSINFGDVLVGESKAESVLVTNTGWQDTLVIFNVVSTSPVFTISPTQRSLPRIRVSRFLLPFLRQGWARSMDILFLHTMQKEKQIRLWYRARELQFPRRRS